MHGFYLNEGEVSSHHMKLDNDNCSHMSIGVPVCLCRFGVVLKIPDQFEPICIDGIFISDVEVSCICKGMVSNALPLYVCSIGA